MASSAHAFSVQTGASVHAPHGRTHNKTAENGDSFADLLNEADASKPDSKDDVAPARENKTAAKPADKKETKENKATDKQADDKAEQSGDDKRQAAEAGKTDKQDSKDVAGTDAATDEKAQSAANDVANDNALADMPVALPQPEQPAPQPVLVAAIAVPVQTAPVQAAPVAVAEENQAATEAVSADGAAPALTPALAPALQTPASAKPEITAGQDENPAEAGEDPAAPATAQAAVKPAAAPKKTAAAAPASAGDFHKTLQEQAPASDAAPVRQAETQNGKPLEPAAPQPDANQANAPKPDANTVALAAPGTTAAPATTMSGLEKPATTAHAETSPQPTPDIPRMAVEVAARSQSGAKQFDIRLDPPELGRVEVRLSIDAHGKAEAHLTADQPQTLDLLQKDAPLLARALREAGLNVQQDGLNFSLKNQQQHFAGGGEQSRQGARQGFNGAKANSETTPAESGTYVRRGLGLLDIRV